MPAVDLIPARRGKACRMTRGQAVKVINTHGSQVVDTWAFNAADLYEFMSMEHSRASMLKLIPGIGDTLVTNRRRPILTVVGDTPGGIHDTLIAACDRYRYAQLGHEGHHDNCTDNMHAAMAELDLEAPETPSPLNLFMNIPVISGKTLSFDPPVSTRAASSRSAPRWTSFWSSRPARRTCCRSTACTASRPRRISASNNS